MHLFYFYTVKKIAVFTSGGDAPGMNACVRAVVRTAIFKGIQVKGIIRGYAGMINDEFIDLKRGSVGNIIQRGGTFLKTARCAEFFHYEGRKKAYDILKKHEIDGLVCIGGNGSYTGAMHLNREFGIPCVGLPGTIDNDLYGTDYTIGYDTAVNTALDSIDRIRDTAHSHDRVFIVEVMGRDSGFIAMDVSIAGGAEGVLIPEDQKDWDRVLKHFKNRKRREKSFSIIVIAEGDEQGGALQLEKKLSEIYPDLKIRSTILGHVQRGGSPTARDRILASRLGAAAVEALLEGQTAITVGLVNDQITYTSFDEAIKGKKKFNQKLIDLANILSQ
jgi:6-phosphofructokinase 1